MDNDNSGNLNHFFNSIGSKSKIIQSVYIQYHTSKNITKPLLKI